MGDGRLTTLTRGRSRRLTRGTVGAAAAALVVAGCAVDLGTLGEGSASAEAVNDAGVIVGGVDTPTGRHAIRKAPGGAIVDLNPSPSAMSSASDINSAGVAVGTSIVLEMRAVLWEPDGTMVDLGVGDSSSASAINAGGTIVGRMGTSGFVRSPSGEVTLLTSTHHDVDAVVAQGVNDSGVVVGYMEQWGTDITYPVRWEAPYTVAYPLTYPAGSPGYGTAVDINSQGDILGTVGSGTGQPAVWPSAGGQPVELAMGPYTTIRPSAINDAGQVVGSATEADPTKSVAVRWDSIDATPVPLGGLGGGSSSAYDINSAGDAVGSAAVRERSPDGQPIYHAALFPHDN